MYSVILFDLDNTLIDRDEAFDDFVRDSFPKDQCAWLELKRLDKNGIGDRADLFARWQQLGGSTMDSAKLGAAIAKRIRPDLDLIDELKRLASKTKIGIITNGSTVNQEAKWLAAGLDTVVPRSRLFVSEALGIRKPDSEIFQIACKVMLASCGNSLFMGDQFENDICGARSAGLHTYLVRRPLTGFTLREAIRRLEPSAKGELMAGVNCDGDHQ